MLIDSFIPSGLAGTLLDGRILSGDDAPAWRAAGFEVEAVCVRCSARIADGNDSASGIVRIAIDCNGRSVADIGRMIGHPTFPATGLYDGARAAVAIAHVEASDVPTLHSALRAHLSGFGCFAVLSEVA